MASEELSHDSPWLLVAARRTSGDMAHLRRVYGSQVQVSRLGVFNLIHLDRPEPEELARRLNCFLDESFRSRKGLRGRTLEEGLDIIFLRRRSQ